MSTERVLPDFTLKQKVGRTIGAGLMVVGMIGGGWGMSELYKLSKEDNSQIKQTVDAQIPPIDDEVVQGALTLINNYESQAKGAAIIAARAAKPAILIENPEELSKSYQIIDQRKAYNTLYADYLKPIAQEAQAFGYLGMSGILAAMLGYSVRILSSSRYRR